MPDPIEELDNFTSPGLTMNPMPAAEVRRRGTRMRRRNTALATVGGIAAVAVIAAPFAVFAGQGDQRDLEPASPTWHQTIPDDFPLAAGMPNGTEVGPDTPETLVRPCADVAWSSGVGTSDSAKATYSGNTEGEQVRILAVYPDGNAAQQRLDTLQQQLEACPADDLGGQRSMSYEVVDSSTGGDDSVAWIERFSDGGGLTSEMTALQMVRVGNALLYDAADSMGGGDPAVVDEQVRALADDAQSVIGKLCVFSADGCGGASSAVDPGSDSSDVAATVIPDGFDLLAGLPTEGATKDFGRVGPGRDLDPIKLDACGQAGPKPGSIDRLRGGFTGPEGERQRQLMTFADEDAAQAYVDSVAELFPCTEDGGNGVTGYYERRDVDLGDSAVAGFLHFIVDGDPGPGYEIVHAVRVGQSVLLSRITVDGENTVITDEVQAELLDETASQLTDVVADMCVFSDDGC